MMLLFYILFFVFGACFASFCNVIIHRMPQGLSVSFPPSHCPKCEHSLRFYHNIPLFSYLFLGGKCAFCKDKISLRYFLVELGGALLFVVALYFSAVDLENFNLTALYKPLFLGLSFCLLLTLSLIDFKYHAVPEIPLISAYFCAIIASVPQNLEQFFAFNSPFVLSLIFAGGITMVKSVVSAWINRNKSGEIIEAMGDADTIIIAIIGAFFGVKLGLACLLLAGILQLILHLFMRKTSQEAPFIPALFIAIIICFAFGEFILSFWMVYV